MKARLRLRTGALSGIQITGVQASKPFVGNGMWVTCLFDPDGYRIEFESPTDVPEETEFSGQDA
jgi:hypothetical protein